MILIVAAACAPAGASDSAPSTTPALIGRMWQLTAYMDTRGNLTPVLPSTQLTATFENTSFVVGSGGCNTYSTVFQSVATTLAFIGPVVTTHRLCEQPVMQQEEAYLLALPRSTGYRFEGDHLVLLQSGGAHVAEYSH